jgi:chorismate lyase / 3-hydroxybenzoate synthase
MNRAVLWEIQERCSRPGPPAWVARLFGDRCIEAAGPEDSAIFDAGDFALAFVRVQNAGGLGALDLQRQVCKAYQSIRATLGGADARHPVRFWNFIPHLHQHMGDGLDRYMVFNAGRFAAFAEWYGSALAFDRRLPTASAVGHLGEDLLVWCLAAREPGMAVENPLQRPSYRYSARYGPMPPSFVRATAIAAPVDLHASMRALLVGGTASIRGESSLGAGHVHRQAAVTLQNLALVVKTASAAADQPVAGVNGDAREWLARYRHLRVYYARSGDGLSLRRLITPRFPNVADIEWTRAPLCRSELLVEIEGVAALEE